MLFHVGHGYTLRSMLAVPSVTVVEDEVHYAIAFEPFLNTEKAHDRRASPAHHSRIFLHDPHPSRRDDGATSPRGLSPPFLAQRKSLIGKHLRESASGYVRMLIIARYGARNKTEGTAGLRQAILEVHRTIDDVEGHRGKRRRVVAHAVAVDRVHA